MQKRLKNQKNIFVIALGLTLLFHTVALIKTVDLDKKFSHHWSDLEQPHEKLDIRLKRPSEDKKQIVQTQDSESEQTPEDAQFLGERDQHFDRETVASETGIFQEAGQGVRDGEESPTISDVDDRPAPETQQAVEHTEESTPSEKTGEVSWEALSAAAEAEPENFYEESVLSRAVAQGLESGNQGQVGLASSNDYVDDVPLGDMTNLNTFEFKYYSFYHRIRQQLEQYWGHTLQQKAQELYAQGRRMPASSNAITSLEIILDSNGEILEIKVQSPSGVKEFDEAAIESFGRAGPFPNPPSGMIKGGKARIQWGFVVKS